MWPQHALVQPPQIQQMHSQQIMSSATPPQLQPVIPPNMPFIPPGMPPLPFPLPLPGQGFIPGLPPMMPVLPGVPPQLVPTYVAAVNGLNGTQEEEEPDEKSNTLEVAHDGRYNVNHILSDNILKSEYFKSLYELRTYHEVIDEIYNHVTNLEPHTVGHQRTPSTAFCLLYKFFVMKLTVKQVKGLITHKDSPYIRGIGFLYLRYLLPAKQIWEYFEPYLDDPEECTPGADKVPTTIGKWLESLITEQKYYATIFPRIPVPVMRTYKRKLLLRERRKDKDKENEKYRKFFKAGTKVQAEYYEDEKFYDAKIDRCIKGGKFLVSFPDYGNQEEVTIGQLKPILGDKESAAQSASRSGSRRRDERRSSKSRRKSRSRSRSRRRSRRRSRSRSRSRSHSRRHSKPRRRDRSRDRKRSRERSSRHRRSRRRHRSRSRSGSRSHRKRRSRSPADHRSSSSRSKSPTTDDLDALIKKQERQDAEAVGRDYAKRPTSYKTSLSIPMQVGTNRARSRTPPPRRPPRSSRRRKVEEEDKKPKTKAKSKEHMAKMVALRQRYGDASVAKKSKTS